MADVRQIGLDEVVRHFEELEDPRSEVNLRHPLPSVVVIALLAVLAGAGGPPLHLLGRQALGRGLEAVENILLGRGLEAVENILLGHGPEVRKALRRFDRGIHRRIIWMFIMAWTRRDFLHSTTGLRRQYQPG